MYIIWQYQVYACFSLGTVVNGDHLSGMHAPITIGKPYDGKASDMWAMGVLLYTMLYGQFPFYDNDPQELFKKIKAADYLIPE